MGATTSALRPAETACHAPTWAGVGSAKAAWNQVRVGALKASSSLTRAGFISSLQNATLPNGVYPPTKFNGGHFGGTGVYSQRMNCSKTEPNQSQAGAWDTVAGPLYK